MILKMYCDGDKMSKKNKKEIDKIEQEINNLPKTYPITISDWIIHLNNKSTSHTNLLIFFATVTMAAIIGTLGTYQSWNLPSYFIIYTVILMFIAFRIVEWIIQKKIVQPHDDLLESIMRGEITDPKEIREKYDKL